MSSKKQYLQMFETPFFNKIKDKEGSGDHKTKFDEIKDEISWARKTLKKNDWVVWYLRLYKLSLIEAHERSISWSRNERLEWKDVEFNKEESFKSKMNKEDCNLEEQGIYEVKENLTHIVDLNLHQINNMTFNWKSPKALFEQTDDYELSWQAENEGKSTPEYGEKIVEFPDGSAWFDLLKPGCDTEASLMGHCGNGSGRPGQRVLSYRRPLEDQFNEDGEQLWVPYLTFILDTNNGELGEMKGRSNSKPAERYHDAIIELLKSEERIEKVVGGGYKAENNFSLEDLSEDKFEQLMNDKPSLFSIMQLYNQYGNVEMIGDFNFAEAIDNDLSEGGEHGEGNEKIYLLHDNIDLEDLADEFNLSDLESYREIITGESHFDHWSESTWDENYESEIQELLEKWSKDNPMLFDRIKYALQNEFQEEIDENNYDLNDMDNLIALCKENSSELTTQFDSAVNQGYDSGADNDLHESYGNLIDDFFKDSLLTIVKNKEDYHNHYIGFTKEQFFEILKDNKAEFESYTIEDGLSMYETVQTLIEDQTIEANDLSVPQYGFSGFCDDSFKNRFNELLDEYASDLKIPEPVSEPFGNNDGKMIPRSIMDKANEDSSMSL